MDVNARPFRNLSLLTAESVHIVHQRLSRDPLAFFFEDITIEGSHGKRLEQADGRCDGAALLMAYRAIAVRDGNPADKPGVSVALRRTNVPPTDALSTPRM